MEGVSMFDMGLTLSVTYGNHVRQGVIVWGVLSQQQAIKWPIQLVNFLSLHNM